MVEERLSLGDKQGGHDAGEVLVAEEVEGLFYVTEVGADTPPGLLDAAGMVDGEGLEVEEVGQALRVGAMKGGAEAGQALQDVAQEVAEGENRTGKAWLPRPFARRDEVKKVLRPLDLFPNLVEEQRREGSSLQLVGPVSRGIRLPPMVLVAGGEHLGVEDLGQNLRGLENARTGAVEVAVSVGHHDPA
jgi:hypothetical protein